MCFTNMQLAAAPPQQSCMLWTICRWATPINCDEADTGWQGQMQLQLPADLRYLRGSSLISNMFEFFFLFGRFFRIIKMMGITLDHLGTFADPLQTFTDHLRT